MNLTKQLPRLQALLPIAFLMLTPWMGLKAQAPGDAIDVNNSNNEWIEIKQNGSLEGMNSLTASIWFKPDNLGEDFAVFGGKRLYEIILDGNSGQSRCSNGNLWWAVDNGTGDWAVNCTNISINTGEWYHVALVSDNNANEIRIYLNGNLKVTNSGTGSVNSNGNSIGIGKRDPNFGEFDGSFDEFRIWSEARSQQQIQDLMHQQINASNYNNLEGYWRLNDGSGSTATDETSNNNDGNLKNNPSWVSSNAVMTDDADLKDGGTFDNDLKGVWPGKGNTDQKGGIKLSNYSSTTSGNYILVGHNGKTSEDTLSSNGNIDTKFGRDWKFDKSGSGNAKITFNTNKADNGTFSSGANPSKSDYLFIEKSGSGYSIDVNGADNVSTSNNTISFSSISVTDGNTHSLGTSDGATSPLPVELMHFHASEVGNSAKLIWATASETQNKHFLVQRRTRDAEGWTKIGEVKGHGTTIERHDYTYTDEDLPEGTYYYRLKQVDYDGGFEIHQVEAVTINGDQKQQSDLNLAALQNPVRDQVQLNINASRSGDYRLTIMNAMGAVVQEQERYMEKGQQDLRIPFREAEAGVYFVKLKSAVGFDQVKIIKTQ